MNYELKSAKAGFFICNERNGCYEKMEMVYCYFADFSCVFGNGSRREKEVCCRDGIT